MKYGIYPQIAQISADLDLRRTDMEKNGRKSA